MARREDIFHSPTAGHLPAAPRQCYLFAVILSEAKDLSTAGLLRAAESRHVEILRSAQDDV
jgi:hypothetical protein